MQLIKRSKISLNRSEKGEQRRFARQKQNNQKKQFYREGARLIIDNRKILGLAVDTLLIAIDIFRSYIQNEKSISEEQIPILCIVSVILASKTNDVHPIRIQQAMQAFEYFGEKQMIIKKEEVVLRSLNFSLPYASDIISNLQNIFPNDIQNKIEEAEKIIYKCLSDEHFYNLQSQVIRNAITIMLGYKNNQINSVNKTVTNTVNIIKSKMEHQGLKMRNLNIISNL